MKNTKLVLTLALGGLLLSAGALNAAAAPGDGTTEGKVEFTEPGDESTGVITKPDTDEEIIEIEDGNFTKGPLRLTQVPSFDFGTMEIASETKFGFAKFNKARPANDANTEATPYDDAIAHFVQVEDLRGGEVGKSDWKLNVVATQFKSGESVLDASAIVLNEGKLFNTRYDQTELAKRVDMKFAPSKTTVIPTTAGGIELLATKTGQNTNSTKTSLVFNNAYTNDKPIGDAAEVAKGNSGVQLKSVGNDEKIKGITYTSTLTWTLVDAI